jgi:putative transposase
MDNCGRWMDNVFIERLWLPMEYEYVYLHSSEIGTEPQCGLAR